MTSATTARVSWFVTVSLAMAACSHSPSSVHEEGPIASSSLALQAANFVGTSLPAKTLALTFDDGPGLRTAELSMYLKSVGIRAGFFVNGNRIATSATLPNSNNIAVTPGVNAILSQLVTDGHLVANHTVTHRDIVNEVLPTGAANLIHELTETDSLIKTYVPSGRFLFRPPYGSWNNSAYNALSGSPMDKYVGPINWEAGGRSDNFPNAAADWACFQGKLNGNVYATTTQCGNAYLNEIRNLPNQRGIVLLHDPYFYAGGSTVDMTKYIVPILQAEGYSFVRIDEVPAINAALPPIACNAACSTCWGPGPAECTACKVGSFLDGSTCKACSVCANGTFQSSACTPVANTVCTACDPSCSACEGPRIDQCGTCPPAFYLDGGACHACTVCASGTVQKATCTGNADTQCEPCSASEPEPGCPPPLAHDGGAKPTPDASTVPTPTPTGSPSDASATTDPPATGASDGCQLSARSSGQTPPSAPVFVWVALAGTALARLRRKRHDSSSLTRS